MYWGNMSSTWPCLEVLKTPTLLVHQVSSLWCLTGNTGCSPALVNIKALSELISSKIPHNFIALLLWLFFCLQVLLAWLLVPLNIFVTLSQYSFYKCKYLCLFYFSASTSFVRLHFQCVSCTSTYCVHALFYSYYLLMYRSEICVIACILTGVMQQERPAFLLATFVAPSLILLDCFSSSHLPSAGTAGESMVHVTRHLNFLLSLAWLPFSLATASQALIC